MLALAHRIAIEGAPVGVELLFTVSEENALAGAKEFDVSQLRIGLRLRARPRLADRRGRRGLADVLPHRGDVPRQGRARRASAPRTGAARSRPPRARSRRCARPARRGDDRQRRHDRTAARAGRTSCPTAARCSAETRVARASRASRRSSPRWSTTCTTPRTCRAARATSTSRSSGCSPATATRPSAPAVLAAEEALRACGYTPTRILTGGGSDANALEAAGFACTNLANGTERNHEPTERVSVAALRGCSTWRWRCWTQLLTLPATRDRSSRPARRCGGREQRVRGRAATAQRRAAIADVGAGRRRARPATTSSSTPRRVDLGLGSGGFDVVHVNLTRGLGGAGAAART